MSRRNRPRRRRALANRGGGFPWNTLLILGAMGGTAYLIYEFGAQISQSFSDAFSNSIGAAGSAISSGATAVENGVSGEWNSLETGIQSIWAGITGGTTPTGA